MQKPIINIKDVKLHPRPASFKAPDKSRVQYDAHMGPIGAIIGAQKLGYNLTKVPKGQCAFPFHNHRVNEEMFLILEGCGELRYGDTTYPVSKMDIIACPSGGKKTAHQLINTGSENLLYLAISTMSSPEIAEYPDSNKFGLLAGFSPDCEGKSKNYQFISREEDSLDYWDGE